MLRFLSVFPSWIGIALWSVTAGAQSPALQVLLSDGEAVQGVDGLFWDVDTRGGVSTSQSAVIAGEGFVAGKMRISGPGVTVDNDDTVFYLTPGGVPQLALREGDPISGITDVALLHQFLDVRLDEAGVLYVRGILREPGNTESVYFLVKGSPATWELLALSGTPYGEDRVFLGPGGFAVNRSGDFVLRGSTQRVEPVENDFENRTHLWRGPPGSGDDQYLVTGAGAPFLSGGETFSSFSQVDLNDQGSLFVASTVGLDTVLFKDMEGTITEIARESEASPDGLTYDLIRDLILFPGSKEAFAVEATVQGEGINLANDGRFFVFQNGGTEPTHSYREGEAVTGISGERFDDVRVVQVDRDRHLLQGHVEGQPGYWLVESQVEKIAAAGDAPSYSPDGAFTTVGGVHIGRTGAVSFQATVASFPGIWTQDPEGQFVLAAGRNVEITLKNGQVRSLLRAYLMEGSGSSADGRFPVLVWSLGSLPHLALLAPSQLGRPPLGISGTVFDDVDYDGQFSTPDQGLPNVVVELFLDDGAGKPSGSALRSQFSQTDGSYAFEDLDPGNYVVRVTPPADAFPVRDPVEPFQDGQITVAYMAEATEDDLDFLLQKELSYQLGFHFHRPDPAIPESVVNKEAGLSAIDTPLDLTTDQEVLAELPAVGFGLVADGVTPLLIRLSGPDTPLPVDRPLRLVLAGEEGGQAGEGFDTKMRVLLGEEWTAMSSTSIEFVLPVDQTDTQANEAQVWLQVRPITADELQLAPGSREVTGILEVWDVETEQQVGVVQIPVRRSPIVLVHSDNSDGSWGPDFLARLEAERPGFIIQVRYGTEPSFEWGLGSVDLIGPTRENAAYSLKALARMLEWELDHNTALNALRKDWAITRFDVLGHGQGGVLARMLSSERGAEDFQEAVDSQRKVRPFRSSKDFFRGRFHRIVTLGSPHNGSRLIYHLNQLAEKLPLWELGADRVNRIVFGTRFRTSQNKWNPLGAEIQALNDPDGLWIPDGQAKFHLVRTTIFQGEPPEELPLINSNTYFFTLSAFLGFEGGSEVLKNGFDGIVDVDSQQAHLPLGLGEFPALNVSWRPVSEEIFHNELLDFASPVEVQNQFGVLAGYLVGLFETGRGFEDRGFGPFPPLPRYQVREPEQDSDLKEIRDYVNQLLVKSGGSLSTSTQASMNVGRPGFPAKHSSDDIESYSLAFTPAEGDPLPESGSVVWTATRYGSQGLEVLHEELSVDAEDATQATLAVPADVPGEYWVETLYQTEDQVWVVSPGFLVATVEPPGVQPVALILSPARLELKKSDVYAPRLFVRYEDGRVLERSTSRAVYTSSSPGVLDLDASGGWEALIEGSTIITASLDGLTATAHWVVQEAELTAEIGWEDWRSAFFEEADLENALVSGPDADPDGDQATNLIEYVRASDPWRSDDFNTILVETVGEGSDSYARVKFPLRDVLENIQVTLQRSNALGQWEDLLIATEPGALDSPLIVDAEYSPSVSIFTLQDDRPLLDGPAERFYRLTAELIQP